MTLFNFRIPAVFFCFVLAAGRETMGELKSWLRATAPPAATADAAADAAARTTRVVEPPDDEPLPPELTKVRDYVIARAKELDVDPRKADWIISKESRYCTRPEADDTPDRGCWQISGTWHPEVSDECAYEVECSTGWALKWIRSGHINEWSVYRQCRELYSDCPF